MTLQHKSGRPLEQPRGRCRELARLRAAKARQRCARGGSSVLFMPAALTPLAQELSGRHVNECALAKGRAPRNSRRRRAVALKDHHERSEVRIGGGGAQQGIDGIAQTVCGCDRWRRRGDSGDRSNRCDGCSFGSLRGATPLRRRLARARGAADRRMRRHDDHLSVLEPPSAAGWIRREGGSCRGHKISMPAQPCMPSMQPSMLLITPLSPPARNRSTGSQPAGRKQPATSSHPSPSINPL